MEMDEQTKKNIYKILEQAKVLEELMKEVELPLSSTKDLALSMNPHRCPLINLLRRTPQEHFHQDQAERQCAADPDRTLAGAAAGQGGGGEGSGSRESVGGVGA